MSRRINLQKKQQIQRSGKEKHIFTGIDSECYNFNIFYLIIKNYRLYDRVLNEQFHIYSNDYFRKIFNLDISYFEIKSSIKNPIVTDYTVLIACNNFII